MRNVAEHVLNEFAKKCIHIPAISFDGLWHNLSVRDATNRPLTKLQLQKNVWREVCAMKNKKSFCVSGNAIQIQCGRLPKTTVEM
ncbi:hypothetical protein DPMN_046458 [Dreissena polymorpha]|uniref:Uncharacterized protein n=1 Tax=Dreissena polymorpha TaxID=45954 RepID=A0A9D4D5Y4_DREPO|nr:hypothetical protein DPMN_046458 [Dreissena polymorpha]